MRMTLGRKGDYAVRAMLYLARRHGEGRRKSREIASQMDIPEMYLPQVLTFLVRAGLVVSVAGPDGGYALARAPADISLLDAVEAAEGPVRNDKCLLRGGPCHWEDACSLHEAWATAQEAMVNELAHTTFEELAEADARLEDAGITQA